jgi:hypothetical protein
MSDINIDTCLTSILIRAQHQHQYLCVANIDTGTVLISISVHGQHQHRYITNINTDTLLTSIPERCRRRYRTGIDSIVKALFQPLSIHYRLVIINSK